MSSLKRKFAFDWGGSLENNSYLRQLARDLYLDGHEVHIIAAAGITPSDETYASWFAVMNIPYTSFHRVLDVGLGAKHIADGKVAKMLELGCHILYDDNQNNIDAVLEAGLEAVKISGEHFIPKPVELE